MKYLVVIKVMLHGSVDAYVSDMGELTRVVSE